MSIENLFFFTILNVLWNRKTGKKTHIGLLFLFPVLCPVLCNFHISFSYLDNVLFEEDTISSKINSSKKNSF